MPLFNIYRPRNYHQLIDHLGDFLPDYLRLREGVGGGRDLLRRRALKFVGTLLLIAVYGGARIGPLLLSGAPMPLGYGWFAVGPLLALTLFFVLDPRRNDERRSVHLAELYFYLRCLC